ncbi:unnamed protein product [Absidia cylindrospora]
MPSSIQKKQRSSKLFQCTGYGDCKMVFTRGEHRKTCKKPFPCIVPDCNKSFSIRQHDAAYSNSSKGISPFELEQQQQQRQQQQQQQRYCHYRTSSSPSNDRDSRVMLHPPSSPMNYSQDIISNYHERPTLGSESPVSLSSSMMDSGSSSDDDYDDYDDETHHHHHHHHHHVHDSWMDHSYRRLSVADMCNPMNQSPLKGNQLTNDEVEVIQAFGQLRQAT